MILVGEVDPRYIHARFDQGFQHTGFIGGRAERTDDLCFSCIQHIYILPFRKNIQNLTHFI